MSARPDEIGISFASSDFVSLGNISLLQSSIMPLIHIRGGVARPVGTCFAISNDGLCVTARHVIEAAFPKISQNDVPISDDDGLLYALYASNILNEDNSTHLGGLLPFYKAHFCDGLDIAAIQLTLPFDKRNGRRLQMPALKLGFGFPAVGEYCFAFGYHAMGWESVGDTMEVDQRFSASRGSVDSTYLPGRDRVIAPFPCFQTSARYDPGMSGGPVMGMDGLIHGVVCSSIDGLNEKDGYISFVSWVTPAILLNIERVDSNGDFKKLFLYDLVELKIVPAEFGGVRVTRLENECRIYIDGGTIRNSLGNKLPASVP